MVVGLSTFKVLVWKQWWIFKYPTLQTKYLYKTLAFGQDATEFKTGLNGYGLRIHYEINVSIKGKHIFATDSYYRQYTAEHIVYLMKLFKEKFPGCKISIKASKTEPYKLPKVIQDFLDG